MLYNEGKEAPIKIFASRLIEKPHVQAAGTFVSSENTLHAYAQDGFLELLEIQLPGKRKMKVEQLIHGLRLKKDAHLM